MRIEGQNTFVTNTRESALNAGKNATTIVVAITAMVGLPIALAAIAKSRIPQEIVNRFIPRTSTGSRPGQS